MAASIKILLMAFGSWLVSFLLRDWQYLALTFSLVFVDLYTGIKAARFRGEEIRSNGLRRTIDKITLYFIAILICEATEVVFHLPDFLNFSMICAGLITITELKSNLENISEFTGNDYWAALVKKLPNLLSWAAPSDKDKSGDQVSNKN
jgi:phage-related holin